MEKQKLIFNNLRFRNLINCWIHPIIHAGARRHKPLSQQCYSPTIMIQISLELTGGEAARGADQYLLGLPKPSKPSGPPNPTVAILRKIISGKAEAPK